MCRHYTREEAARGDQNEAKAWEMLPAKCMLEEESDFYDNFGSPPLLFIPFSGDQMVCLAHIRSHAHTYVQTNTRNMHIRPPHCIDNFLSRCSEQWFVPVRRAHQAGCRHYPLRNMVSPCIRKHSGMPCACITDGTLDISTECVWQAVLSRPCSKLSLWWISVAAS